MRIKFEVLEDHSDAGTQRGKVSAFGGNIGAVDDDPTLLDGLKPVHAFDQRRLA
jgi:hypothetical protein